MLPEIPELLRRLPIDERRLRHDRVIRQAARVRRARARRRILLNRLGRTW